MLGVFDWFSLLGNFHAPLDWLLWRGQLRVQTNLGGKKATRQRHSPELGVGVRGT